MKKTAISFPVVLLLWCLSSLSLAADPNPEPQPITDVQYKKALIFHQQHGHPDDIRLFDQNTLSHQALVLGSLLMIKGGDAELAERLMLQAIQHPEELGKFDHGYALHMLAELYQQQDKLEGAEQFYRQAISVDYEDACNNLGVMWEQQGQYQKALKLYESCLPKLATAKLLLNLGTLYYNGLGIRKDYKAGGKYWQQSYDEFAYDPDINYNLGLYHLRYSHDFAKARYHLALAIALGDLDALTLLREKKVFGEYADQIFADELRLQDSPNSRRWLIADRLQYLHNNSVLDGEDEQGVRFELSDDGERLTLTAPAKTKEQVDRAVIQMFWLIYVDQLSPISVDIAQFGLNLESNKIAILIRYGWQLKAEIEPDGRLRFEAFAHF